MAKNTSGDFEKFISRWRPWEKKFAWCPMIINKKLIWLITYYERRPWCWPDTNVERATNIFTVLE